MPGVRNVNVNRSPRDSDPESQAPPSAVHVCAALSRLVAVTAVPTEIVIVRGEKAKSWMVRAREVEPGVGLGEGLGAGGLAAGEGRGEGAGRGDAAVGEGAAGEGAAGEGAAGDAAGRGLTVGDGADRGAAVGDGDGETALGDAAAAEGLTGTDGLGDGAADRTAPSSEQPASSRAAIASGQHRADRVMTRSLLRSPSLSTAPLRPQPAAARSRRRPVACTVAALPADPPPAASLR